jgi:hypothetical protein
MALDFLPIGKRSNLFGVPSSYPFSSRLIAGICLFRGNRDLPVFIADLVKGNHSGQV